MKEHGILMDQESVKGLHRYHSRELHRLKTQTSRFHKLKKITELHEDRPGHWCYRREDGCWEDVNTARLIEKFCYYGVGDLLWVRETWGLWDTLPKDGPERAKVFYRATDGNRHDMRHQLWRPSIFMPKWAARMWLEVVEITPKQVQNFTHEERIAEGFRYSHLMDDVNFVERWWRDRWNGIHGKDVQRCYAANPYVFVIKFREIKR